MNKGEHVLTQVGENTFFIKGETNIGVYRRQDGSAVVIDTGFAPMGEEIDRLISDAGMKPAYILNTHSHRDHMDGNTYLMDKYGIPAYCSRYEILFDEYPDLEPAFFFGGYPEKRLLQMFGHEKRCGLEPISESPAEKDGIEIIDVPGHSPEMVGFKTPDEVWFLGDSYLGLGYLKNHRFGYMYRVDEFLRTLEKISELKGCAFIPGHGRMEENVSETIEANRRNIREQLEVIEAVCERPAGFDEITGVMSREYRLPEDVGFYAMQSTNIRSMLSYLEDRGRVGRIYQDGIVKWQCK